MPSARVTSKGQVTTPVDVRRQLGLRPGSRLTFEPTEGGGYEIHAEGSSIRDLEGAVRAPTTTVSLEDMEAATVRALGIRCGDRPGHRCPRALPRSG